jgi:mRNA interferase RelE/StbE
VEKYKVSIKRSAVKEIEAIPQKKERQRIIRRIGQLADNPRPPGSGKLSGHDRYRIRHGVYRIVYGIDENELVVLVVVVVKVGHRKDVYRGPL